MLKRELKLSVEEPCSENWDLMKAQEHGRYCRKCSKHVVDFTQFSDQELVNWFSKERAQVCGRLTDVQLDKSLHTIHSRPASFATYRWILGISLGIGLISRMDARDILPKAKIAWTDSFNKSGTSKPPENHSSNVFYITVMDSFAGVALQNVKLAFYSEHISTRFVKTDSNGYAVVKFKNGNSTGRHIVIRGYEDSSGTVYNDYTLNIEQADSNQITIYLEPRVQRLQTVSCRTRGNHIVGAITFTVTASTTKSKKHGFWYRLTWPVRKLYNKLR